MADAPVGQSIQVITDLLLGAVYADGVGDGSEVMTVRDLLKELLDAKQLPEELEKRIASFDHESFDVNKTAAQLGADAPIKKRKLLELVAAVRDADEEIDLAEDDYIVSLAKALGMQKSEYHDLTVDYEIEELRAHLGELRSIPPPIKK